MGLVRLAGENADRVVTSVFVNPPSSASTKILKNILERLMPIGADYLALA